MPHSVRLSDEVFEAYKGLAKAIGLPSVASAIGFTATQALPHLKSKFAPGCNPQHSAGHSSQSAGTLPQSAAVGPPTATISSNQPTNSKQSAPSSSPLAALLSAPIPE